MKKFINIKTILLIIGALFCLNSVILLFVSDMNIGLFCLIFLGLIFLTGGIFFEGFVKRIPNWMKITFLTGVGVVIIFIGFLLIYGNGDNVNYNEDAVIVLGCGIRGEEVGASLKSRLDRAIDYYNNNQDVLIVVSGGKGTSGAISEAMAMERYLINKGIPKEDIIKEELSTNTYENFVYSKNILDTYFNEPYTVAYITNDYHVFRAGVIAGSVGYDEVTHCSAFTPWYMLISSCIRECIGVIKFVVFKQ